MFSGGKFKKALKSFTSAQSGNVGVLFALSILPMFMAVGAAIDIVRLNNADAQVQSALDAAALTAAATKNVSDATRFKIAQEAFKANLTGNGADKLGASATFSIKDGKVVGTATAELETSLMKLAGVNALDLNLEAEVNMLTDKKAELVLVLDYSGSMGDSVKGGTKYRLMSAAASQLIHDLEAVGKDKVKVGLVPFSQYVRVTLPGGYVAGATGASWTGCTQDRGAPYNVTDKEPDGSNDSKWGQPINGDHAGYTCGDFTSRNLEVVPLTNDFDKVTSKLGGMRPGGWTQIALGLEFGYHLISKSAPYTEAVEFGDKETEKFVVVLTDGSQTERAKGPGGVNTVEQGEKNLEALCANIKSKDVTLITMAFDLTDKDPSRAEETKARLRSCATSAGDYFDANDGADLAKAFGSIQTKIAQNIFLNK